MPRIGSIAGHGGTAVNQTSANATGTIGQTATAANAADPTGRPSFASLLRFQPPATPPEPGTPKPRSTPTRPKPPAVAPLLSTVPRHASPWPHAPYQAIAFPNAYPSTVSEITCPFSAQPQGGCARFVHTRRETRRDVIFVNRLVSRVWAAGRVPDAVSGTVIAYPCLLRSPPVGAGQVSSIQVKGDADAPV